MPRDSIITRGRDMECFRDSYRETQLRDRERESGAAGHEAEKVSDFA